MKHCFIIGYPSYNLLDDNINRRFGTTQLKAAEKTICRGVLFLLIIKTVAIVDLTKCSLSCVSFFFSFFTQILIMKILVPFGLIFD